jgi:effector-binding domain-containing protein
MKKSRVLLQLLSAICLMAAGTVTILAKSRTAEPAFAIRKADSQVVLYTIFRGSYDKAGPAVGRLFALAHSKQIKPSGPASYAYLNNPRCVSMEHWLTEIRIPVDKDALKFAGTLGPFTDVKALPDMQLAVAIKPEGQADPAPIYEKLYAWLFKQGYIAADAACETFLTNAMSGDYTRMKTEIAVPVEKLSLPGN